MRFPTPDQIENAMVMLKSGAFAGPALADRARRGVGLGCVRLATTGSVFPPHPRTAYHGAGRRDHVAACQAGPVAQLCAGGHAGPRLRPGGLARRHIRARRDAGRPFDGRQAVANNIAEIAGSPDEARELRHLVATFDGNRHVQATFTSAQGATIAASVLQTPAPRFRRGSAA